MAGLRHCANIGCCGSAVSVVRSRARNISVITAKQGVLSSTTLQIHICCNIWTIPSLYFLQLHDRDLEGAGFSAHGSNCPKATRSKLQPFAHDVLAHGKWLRKADMVFLLVSLFSFCTCKCGSRHFCRYCLHGHNFRSECGLTIRSTGHIAACRHLPRHFILGQMPPHHNVPVSSNVRPHNHANHRNQSHYFCCSRS